MPERRELVRRTLDDPRALRAVAHEARYRVLTALSDGRELTATEAAELCGLTPSAMSYHLRMLERYGIVERAEPSGDGRERPWRVAADHVTVDAGAETSGSAATTMIALFLGEVQQALARSVAPADDGERFAATARRGVIRLDPERAEEMVSRVQAVLDEYDTKPSASPAATDDATDGYDVFFVVARRPPT